LDEAHKVRSRLIDLFTQYDAQSKRILQTTTLSETDKRVQTAINTAAVHFLQTNLLPLQSIPRVLKPKSKSPLSETNGVSPAKEKELKEKMMVLEEQKYLVENMIQQAQKGRRMEEVKSLKENVSDLDDEIDKIKSELGDLFIA
jgi:rabenosyn-5